MHASKDLTVCLPPSLPAKVPASPWRVEAPPTTEGRRWSLRGLFGRKPPSLFQRCLAVHIYHASQQNTLH